MRRTKTMNLRRVGCAFIGILGMLVAAVPATAGPVTFTWSITNNSGGKVTDAELTFTGTGGSIANPKTVKDDPTGDPGMVTVPAGNMIRIDWPGLKNFPNKAVMEFSFTVDVPIPKDVKYLTGKWTGAAVAGGGDLAMTTGNGGNVVITMVPEPSSLVTGCISALMGLVYWQHRRRAT